MNTDVIALIISIINLIAFLLSIFIIVRQMKQVERSIRGSTYQSLIEQVSDINSSFVEHIDMAQLWGDVSYVGRGGSAKSIRQAWTITRMMDFYENMYFQHKQGNIPEEIWERWEKHIKNVFLHTKVKKQWKKAQGVYYLPFRNWVNEFISEKPSE